MHKEQVKTLAVYISGPMSGIDEMNYPKFYAVQEELEGQGYKVYNPARIAEELTPVEKDMVGGILNLGESIKKLSDREWLTYIIHDLPYIFRSDIMYMLKGWEASTGANIEYAVALRMGLTIIYEEEQA